ncbi:MAG: disulfide bond formation protein B [Alphaproteobacteria bacterium]|nr:disulfide bond formation protein B [Alphaproteobacteria bacterium]|tara:strand:+ start:164 stop:694 length:531 start_codon:yes stop_codon:yes gene_type:complete
MAVPEIRSRLLAQPRLWPALTLAASAAMLATAWGFQLIGGFEPCTLCIYQRWPYWIMIVLAALGVLAARRMGVRGLVIFAGAGAIVFLGGAGVAGFHVGVEQGWWEGLSTCGGGLDDPGMSIEELKHRLLSTKLVRCDDVTWSLFGISMAGYNFLISLALAGASLWAARGFWRMTA